MQACQLCGAKSWGPVKEPTDIPPIVSGAGSERFVECDVCGSLAREDFVADYLRRPPPSDSLGPVGPWQSIGLSPIDYEQATRSAQTMLTSMGIAPKDPETRTERLVRSMLDITNMDNHTPQALVMFARAIESELDRCCAPPLQETTALPVLKPRDFQQDFLIPASNFCRTRGLPGRHLDGLALALDIAIAYGALEALTGNESMQDLTALDRAYWQKVERLRAWV